MKYKYKPIEPSGDLMRELCVNICEDMKHLLSELCYHNSYYPKHKITIEYKSGDNFCILSDEKKDEVNFIHRITADNCICSIGFIEGYSKGISAAGIRSTTPNEL